VVSKRKLARNWFRGNCTEGFRLRLPGFQRSRFEGPSELLVSGWLEAGRLFEDIQESYRAIDSVTLRIAYSFYEARTFQSFDGALRGRKRDRQFVRHALCSDEGICRQKFDYT
jgi:hypothetical protein